MSLVHRNDMVEQVPSATADPALGHAVLPRALDGGLQACDLHGSNRSRHFQSILCIMIKDEKLGGRLVREGLSRLLDNPGASRMTCDVEVEDAPPVMTDDEEQYRQLKVTVGTVKKSMAAMASR